MLSPEETAILITLRRKLNFCKVCDKPIINRTKNAKYCKVCAEKKAKEYHKYSRRKI